MGTDEIRRALLRMPPGPERAALMPAIYAALAAGELTEAEAAELDASTRLPPRRSVRPVPSGGVGGASAPQTNAGPPAITPSRVRGGEGTATVLHGGPAPRLPFPRRPIAREDVARRRRWAASGWLPPELAARFTPGELAALSVVASYAFIHGSFAASHATLARWAGVSESLARNALREARRLGLITCEERRSSPYRHRPNVVRIVGREWVAWLRNRRTRQGVRISPADNTAKENQGFSGSGVAAAAAPGLDSRGPRDAEKWRRHPPTRKTRSA